MFRDEEELREIRTRAHSSFCEKQEPEAILLDAAEEYQLFRYYQKKLVELCKLYAPPKWVPLPRTALVRSYVSHVLLFMYVYRRQRPWHISRGFTYTRL